MRAAFDDAPAVEYEDDVGGKNSAEAVSNDDAGAPRHDSFERLLDEHL